MMQRALRCFLIFAIFVVSASAIDLPAAWRAWRYSSPVNAQTPDALSEIILPANVLSHSENRLADLRVIDGQGSEIPYVLYSKDTTNFPLNSEAAQIRENSFVPGQFTQVILELPKTSVFRDTIKIETPESNFMNWVEVAASDG